MGTRKSREINVFGLSFMDVLANTIGGLAFLLIMAVLMAGVAIQFSAPSITTERLPDGYDRQEYAVWLAAQEGLGKFRWKLLDGEPPQGLTLEAETGKLSGRIQLPEAGEASREFAFSVACEAQEASNDAESTDKREFKIVVYRNRPTETVPLRIVSESTLPAAQRGQPFPLALAAEGGQPPYQWSARGGLPPGLTLLADGRMRGAPNKTGEYHFEVAVHTIQQELDAKSFHLVVSEKHPPPPPIPPLRVVTSVLPDAVAEHQYRVQPAAEGGKPPYGWRLISQDSKWLSLEKASPAFAGRPVVSDIGVVDVVCQVVDGRGETADSPPIKLEVLPPVGKKPQPLRIKTQTLPEGRVGDRFALAISVEGGIAPYAYSLQEPLLATGLRFDAREGGFGGIPEINGKWPTTFLVRDAVGQSARAEYALRVRPGRQPLQIVTRSAADARVDQSYELALSATGGFPHYSWSLAAGELPPGLTLEPRQGKVIGTPTEAGNWQADFMARDAEGETAPTPVSLDFQVLTRKGVTRLVVRTVSLPLLTTGRDVNLAMACEGGQPPYQWEAPLGLPPGLSFSRDTLVGMPVVPGIYPARLRVRDSTGQTIDINLPIEIRWLTSARWAYLLAALLAAALVAFFFLCRRLAAIKPRPLEINTAALANARASCDYVAQLSCIGGVPPYHWCLVGGELPPGMSLTEEGILSGRPLEGVGVDETKDFPFTVQVRDSKRQVATQSL